MREKNELLHTRRFTFAMCECFRTKTLRVLCKKQNQTNKQTKQLLNEVNHNKPRVNMIHFIHLLETNNNSPV